MGVSGRAPRPPSVLCGAAAGDARPPACPPRQARLPWRGACTRHRLPRRRRPGRVRAGAPAAGALAAGAAARARAGRHRRHPAEGVEAWAFRAMQDRAEFLDRPTAARRWFEEEYEPVVAMLREAGLVSPSGEADAYLRVAAQRYRVMFTHAWSEEIVERLRDDDPAPRRPA